jgi:hypothetical protein
LIMYVKRRYCAVALDVDVEMAKFIIYNLQHIIFGRRST